MFTFPFFLSPHVNKSFPSPNLQVWPLVLRSFLERVCGGGIETNLSVAGRDKTCTPDTAFTLSNIQPNPHSHITQKTRPALPKVQIKSGHILTSRVLICNHRDAKPASPNKSSTSFPIFFFGAGSEREVQGSVCRKRHHRDRDFFFKENLSYCRCTYLCIMWCCFTCNFVQICVQSKGKKLCYHRL